MRKIILSITATCFLFACNQPKPKKQPEPIPKADTTRKTVQNPQQNALTLPVLDAMFYDPDFSKSLKDSIGLSPAEIGKLRKTAHESLRELSENGVDTASARNATNAYQTSIRDIIGEDKLAQLTTFVNTRYSKGVEGLAPTEPNFVPKDTRIVVNAPAFRLDVFKNGQLLETYKIGIGYPEFPLPTGMRRADTIIFNPSWTPPYEPWVKGHFSPGVKVSAANELNPLGIIKIPIGKPSLIHGGKSPEQIGGFASHGCVGLTNALVQDLTGYILMLGNSDLTKADIKSFAKHLGKSNAMRLPNPVPIDLRYETIVAGDGMLHIFRDVYERGTNTLENAKNILEIYNIRYDQLSEQEQSDLAKALDEMNRDPHGNAIAGNAPSSQNGVAASKQDRSKKGQVTRKIKGKKQADVSIAALQGKGYPAPVE